MSSQRVKPLPASKPISTATVSEGSSPPSSSLPTAQQTIVRRLQRATGFEKSSNLWLFLLFPCIFSLFCILSLRSLNYEEVWGKTGAPGEWYWFRKGIERVGMKIHLWSVIPAGALMPLQFLPVLRRRYITIHRLNGYLLLFLLMSGNISALIISRRAFGGTVTTQTGVLSLAIQTTFTLTKGIIAIRNLRIDEHRIWMIRTWGIAASILTIRILIPIRIIFSLLGVLDGHKVVTTCDELLFMYDRESLPLDIIYSAYPACQNFTHSTSTSPIYVVAVAGVNPNRPETIAGTISTVFGATIWASQVFHLIGVEWYIRSSKGEDERLKKVSLAKRRAMGMEMAVEKES